MSHGGQAEVFVTKGAKKRAAALATLVVEESGVEPDPVLCMHLVRHTRRFAGESIEALCARIFEANRARLTVCVERR